MIFKISKSAQFLISVHAQLIYMFVATHVASVVQQTRNKVLKFGLR